MFSMAWHPLGHALATGSKDQTVKFYSRRGVGAAVLASPEAREASARITQPGILAGHLENAAASSAVGDDLGSVLAAPVVTAAAAAGKTAPLKMSTASVTSAAQVVALPTTATATATAAAAAAAAAADLTAVPAPRAPAKKPANAPEDEDGPPRQRRRR